MCHTRGRRGFVLVDLVFLVAVLGLGAAMLIPSLFRSREAARRSQCSNNLKQVCLALLNYEHQNKTFPAGIICDQGEDPALTDVFRPNWVILTLAFMEQRPLQRAFGDKVPISDEKNRLIRGTSIPGLLCPTDLANNRKPFAGSSKAEGDNWARGNYAVNAGNVFLGKDGGVVDAKSAQWRDKLRRGIMAVNDATMDLAGIRDGTSETILVGEIRAGVTDKDRRGVWAMGMAGSSIACAHGSWGDANGPNAWNRWADDIKGADQIELGRAAEDQCMDAWGKSGSRQATFRSLHPGGCNVVFADNSVHFISDAIETSGPWGDAGPEFWPVWDRLICSGDRHPLDTPQSPPDPTPEQLRAFQRQREREVAAAESLLERFASGHYRISGAVRFKDGAIPEGRYRFVTFHPDRATVEAAKRTLAPAKGAGGEIRPDGHFEMTTIKPGDGVLPGRYKVTIKCLKSYADPDSLTIPKKYAEFATTPLEVTIEKRRSDLEFVLEK